jgi:hypothetical protein
MKGQSTDGRKNTRTNERTNGPGVIAAPSSQTAGKFSLNQAEPNDNS